MTHKAVGDCITPVCDFIFHKREIEDVSFNHFHDSIFASCDDGGFTAFWDLRSSNKPIHTAQNHEGTIYSLEFSPLNEFLWASGGEDTIAKVWDIRNSTEPLFSWKTST
jgi:histone-binding protein RBBP4